MAESLNLRLRVGVDCAYEFNADVERGECSCEGVSSSPLGAVEAGEVGEGVG
jgi:hypothetical protein